ncbi:molybdopterin-guanine dinucleotide biosynthesis protein B [Archaeoglobales archaeon]|nr:MAG: molybdopterin-guanine dinucleotide biosynthesis protein B [Archaeoglobales archaeon]
MIVSVVGESGVGKTSFIEKLVPLLKRKNLKVLVVKHAKKGFEIDKRGKDSYRLFQSGADVAILAPIKFALIKRVENDDLDSYIGYFSEYDVIITEGFSQLDYPKIVIGSGNYKNVLVRIKSDFSDSDVKKVAEIIIEGVRNGSKKGCGSIRGEV